MVLRAEQELGMGFVGRIEPCKLGRIGRGKKTFRRDHQELSKAFKK
jgi:hypothetical protein